MAETPINNCSQITLQKDLFFEFLPLQIIVFGRPWSFARKNLDEKNTGFFQRLFNILNATSPKSLTCWYIFTGTPEKLLKQINLRDRWIWKQHHGLPTLKNIQDSYFEFFYSQTSYPIVIVDIEDIDFCVSIPHTLRRLNTFIFKESTGPGLHRISLRLWKSEKK